MTSLAAINGWTSTASGRSSAGESQRSVTSAFCPSAAWIKPRRRAAESSKAINATLRADGGREKPRPNGPRRMSEVPGLHSAGSGGAQRNPKGEGALKKTGTGKREWEAGAWAERYCPGLGISPGGH